MKNDLRPDIYPLVCPACKGESAVMSIELGHYRFCKNCGLEGRSASEKHTATVLWNDEAWREEVVTALEEMKGDYYLEHSQNQYA
jgi:hypothetical protein